MPGILVMSPPLMYNQDTRALALETVIVGKVPLKNSVSTVIVHLFPHYSGLAHQGKKEN